MLLLAVLCYNGAGDAIRGLGNCVGLLHFEQNADHVGFGYGECNGN